MSLIAAAWMCHGQSPWLGLRTQAAKPTSRSTRATLVRVVAVIPVDGDVDHPAAVVGAGRGRVATGVVRALAEHELAPEGASPPRRSMLWVRALIVYPSRCTCAPGLITRVTVKRPWPSVVSEVRAGQAVRVQSGVAERPLVGGIRLDGLGAEVAVDPAGVEQAPGLEGALDLQHAGVRARGLGVVGPPGVDLRRLDRRLHVDDGERRGGCGRPKVRRVSSR